MIEAIQWAGNFVYDTVDYWPDWVWEVRRPDRPRGDQSVQGPQPVEREAVVPEAEAMDRRRGRIITMMRWALPR